MYSITEKHLLLTAVLRCDTSAAWTCFTSYKGLCSLSLCAIVMRSVPPSHLSTSNGQRSSQLFCVHYTGTVSRGSSGSIVSDYGLDDRAIWVRSPAGAKDFSYGLFVQNGSGAHPAFCTMGTGVPFPGTKARPGRDADHSPPSSAEVEYELELYLLSSKRLHGV
jgi:hypothetical protein